MGTNNHRDEAKAEAYTAMVRNIAHHWTPDEEVFLEQLLHEGNDLRLTAMRMKRSIAVVQHHADDGGRVRHSEDCAAKPKHEPGR